MSKQYGAGSITLEGGKWRVRVPDGSGKHITIGRYSTFEEAEQMRSTALLARLETGVGTTLRWFGEAWLHEQRAL
ncbi:MAG: hypothetical protein RL701_5817, partial [Pseudomonadota bacterium]